MGTVNTASLNRAAVTYNPIIQKLPFLVLLDTVQAIGVNLMEVIGKDKEMTYLRNGGISKPYVVSSTPTTEYTSEVGKFVERTLEPEPSVAVIKDHIMNYRDKQILSSLAAQKVDPVKKQHPLEMIIIESKVRTVAEDILTALFHAERDTTDKSPLGMFDGFNTILDDYVTSGEIAVAKGNKFATGAIVAPADTTDTEAWDKLVAFVRSANVMLRKNCILYIPSQALFYAMDALSNKFSGKSILETDVFLNYLRGATQAPNLKIISDPVLGTGDRLMLIAPGLLDLGLNTMSAPAFVQVRDPYEDPNLVQFWTQWEAGTRIKQTHAKMLLINDGTPESLDLSGDYSA